MHNAPMSRRSLLGSVAAVAAASVPGAAAAMNGLAAVTDNPDAELYKSSDIEVLRGLEAVRRRPAMYIGADELRAGLLEWVVNDIACERPQEIRILLWRKDAFTIAYDGRPLPIEPSGLPVDGVPHPALYQPFMYLVAGAWDPVMPHFPVLNALSERLVVSTMHAGHRYRVVFSKGMIVELLSCTHCIRPLGITWLTFRPDAMIVTGDVLSSDDVQRTAERVRRKAEGVRICVEDRMTEDADWS